MYIYASAYLGRFTNSRYSHLACSPRQLVLVPVPLRHTVFIPWDHDQFHGPTLWNKEL